MGKGFEIKASDLASGKGYWRTNEEARNSVRPLLLTAPKTAGTPAFIVVVDKRKHLERYEHPDPPHTMALQFIFERIQYYLDDESEHAFCIYDHNRRADKELNEMAGSLIRDGSSFMARRMDGRPVTLTMPIDRIEGFGFGDSLFSLGINIADFFASMAYRYFKEGSPKDCGWWNDLEESLWRRNGHLAGYGLKQFP